MSKQAEHMTDMQLFQTLQQLPLTLKREVLHFIQALLKKQAPPEPPSRKIPQFGKGKVGLSLSPDFDAPMEDVSPYM